jgi:hypothetical protein
MRNDEDLIVAFAALASGAVVAAAQGVIIETPGVKVTPPRVEIETRDRPAVINQSINIPTFFS